MITFISSADLQLIYFCGEYLVVSDASKFPNHRKVQSDDYTDRELLWALLHGVQSAMEVHEYHY